MLKGIDFKAMIPHIVAVLAIIASAFIYCSPVIEGKRLIQSDIVKHKAQAHESQEYRAMGKETLWTTRVFSGMSTFNIDAKFKTNIMRAIGQGPFHLSTWSKSDYCQLFRFLYTSIAYGAQSLVSLGSSDRLRSLIQSALLHNGWT